MSVAPHGKGRARALRRFQSSYVVDSLSGCWLWNRVVTWQGYGKFHLNGTLPAHRAAWQLHRGPIPEEAHVLHKCDKPACVNPEHLFLGTHLENMRDKVRKARQFRPAGDRNGHAKLTNAQAKEARRLHLAGASADALCQRFGLSHSSVSALLNRKTYADAI